ncbi:rhodanese-like domain-containing protein [Ekhidna sp.]|uniref:sulfurtransferase n=1 Tax=Ekhidna sp. TaxID=2608089 RepID=UPI003298DE2F
MNGLITTDWLQEHLADNDLIILDASQSTSVNNLNDVQSAIYIPGAISLSLKEWSDSKSQLPNTFPSPEHFASKCREIGIKNDSKIVVYDNQGIYFSPRIWWMFKVMGHDNVAVLNGGLPAWINEARETASVTRKTSHKGNFKPKLVKDLLKSYDQIYQNIDSNEFVVVDARSKGRFDGTAPEPREGLSSGHIPKSVNLPYTEVSNGTSLKNQDELQNIFNLKGLSDRKMVFSCGSGLTACIVALARHQLTNQLSPIYDGSWTEWAQIVTSPIATAD